MVNKPHAQRGSKAGKKPSGTAATANGEDTSYIVFGKDEKAGKKGKQPPVTESAASTRGGKSKEVVNGAPQPEAEKKPDTRTLIAGSSWTGKLPMTLFNEHCQKQRWDKPEYTMHRNKGGKHVGGVIIRQRNQKTQEVTQLPEISPPREYNNEKGGQDSAVEARHFAATYALFRVGNMKNLSMALPPQYRDLWKGDFQELKQAAIAQGQGHLYEADPFLAVKHREEAKAVKEKERAEIAKKKQQTEKQATVTLDGQIRRPDKGWGKSPWAEMGVRTRREVEHLIRSGAVWNVHGIQMSMTDRRNVVERLSRIGFRTSHAEEAADVCADFEEALEWLLIHMPEDDVPKWALPENYLAGVALAASDLQKEGKIKRLAAAGYSRDVCSDILDGCDGVESKAAFALQHRLLGDEATGASNEPGISDLWEEEQATLEAIFSERYSGTSDGCIIQLELQTPSREPIRLRVRLSKSYPTDLPAMAVETPLPAYIKLSILRQCLLHAKENFLGEMMLFNVLDFLEQEIPRIIDTPGRLQSIAGATSTSNEPSSKASSAPRKQPKRHPRMITWTKDTNISQRLRAEWCTKQSRPDQQRMLQARQGLPAWSLRDAIVASVMGNQVTIISGETGSGKSTQSVQFILDDLIDQGLGEHANIVCTQPRRISALGLADRVADERCARVGDEVGYTIRGESKQRAGMTKITFVTTGVLLRRLQTSGGSAEDVVASLADVSHVVIDEVHERSLDTDFLLVLLRDVLAKRKDLKLVLMSATLDADVFEAYFDRVSSVGRVEIAGRTHPVQDIHLEEVRQLVGYGGFDAEEDASDTEDNLAGDFALSGGGGRQQQQRPKPRKQYGPPGHDGHTIDYDFIAQTVKHIDAELGREDGGILIFLPGTMEIDRTLRSLAYLPNLHALPLHAGLQSAEQKRVFARPPRGLRKVVCATNVAETSITIDDIVAVIDTGRVKETTFDPAKNMVRLTEMWASRAACKQRRGRAGRVRAGKAYKLYTKMQEARMLERPEPEIRRVPLEQLCLSVKAMGVTDVPAFLASALTPPETLSVKGAITILERVGALDRNELTAMGRHMSMIPADLRVSKLMVYGAAFGCLDACLTIAATLTVKSPFVSPQAKRDEAKAAKAAFGRGQGDLMCDLRAFEEWWDRRSNGEQTSSLRRWCDDNFLNHQTLVDISSNRNQYSSSLQEIGFLPPGHQRANAEAYNRHNDSDALLRALVAGAFQPQLARIEFPSKKYVATAAGNVAQDPEAHTIKYFNEENGRVFVHPGSTLFSESSFPANSVFMSYFTKMATSKVFIRDLTPFNVFSLLMFGGPVTIDPEGRGLLVDGWVRVQGWARIGVLVSRLRMMLDDLLARKVDEPGLEMSEADIVRIVRRMVTFDGLDR
ncbi:hypothetical protein B0A50_03745 [Salinomyces thailandicus]|uniref:P-loop containing nucleoside triphosphate hydrolase protein n=1 Tax=Salinomyces thailandicus TaxID=706561 RepID=A0A4U0U4Z8_9PEZI|nr:hypothetical protein B0A50_03745 [Salinomyces thailandica]